MNVPTLIRAHLVSVAVLLGACIPPGSELPEPSVRFQAFVDAEFSESTADDDRAPYLRLTEESDSLRYATARTSLARLRAIDTSFLRTKEVIDWLLLEASFKRTLRDSALRIPERMPGRYLTLGSLEWRVGRDQKPDAEEWRSVLQILIDAPQALDIGMDRLKDPPTRWVDLALGTAGRLERYLEDQFLSSVRSKAPPQLQDSLVRAAETAGRALREFDAFLSDSLESLPAGSWATGREYYDWLLKEYHFLPYDVDAMIEQGWEVHERTKAQLRAIAERSGTGRTWRELVAEMKGRHPEPFAITDAYIQESFRARALIESSRMIEIPPAETLLFVPTPPALRDTYAWGGYGGIRLIDSVMSGRFFVTDIVEGMAEDEIRQKLRTQNDGWITVIALHEGYPGHHLQAVYARLNPQKVRARLGSTYFGEGWALYCESWMGRNGFYVDTWDSLGWLNMRLWRTARVILDPSLHAGRMSYDDAVTFFMDEVGLERTAAEAEVTRYTTWPTQAPSYIIGWLEIEKLNAFMRERFTSEYSERRFAETLLRTGSLPPALLERAILDEWEQGPDRVPDISLTD